MKSVIAIISLFFSYLTFAESHDMNCFKVVNNQKESKPSYLLSLTYDELKGAGLYINGKYSHEFTHSITQLIINDQNIRGSIELLSGTGILRVTDKNGEKIYVMACDNF
jgi:hypothetical protein